MQIKDFPIRSPDGEDWLIFQTEEGITFKSKVSSLPSAIIEPVIIENLASQGTVTASSTFSNNFLPIRATDENTSTDWASLGETNPWIQINFLSPKSVLRVRICDRIGTSARVNAGILSFSDSSTISVPGISNNGTFATVTFSKKTVSWVRFTVSSGSGINVGLSELQIIGY